MLEGEGYRGSGTGVVRDTRFDAYPRQRGFHLKG